MAALSQNRPTARFGGLDGGTVANRIPVPIADNVHILQGGLVQANASGYATPAGTATTVDTSTYTTLGKAYREYDNTGSGHALGAQTWRWSRAPSPGTTAPRTPWCRPTWARTATPTTTTPWPTPATPAPPPSRARCWR
jgi:hypothetical protein